MPPAAAVLRPRVTMPVLAAVLVGAVLWWRLPPPSRAVLPAPDGDASRCQRMVFASDGRCLATWHWPTSGNPVAQRVLRTWDATDGRPRAMLHRGKRQLESLAFAPDGRAIAGHWFDGAFQVWDPQDGRELAEYRHEAWKDWNPHLQIVYNPEGRLLAHGPQPGSGQLWDVADGTPARTLFTVEGWTTAYGGYEGFVVAGKDDEVNAWHLASGQRSTFAVPGGSMHTGSFALTPDGRLLAGYVDLQPGRGFTVWESGAGAGRRIPAGDDSVAPVLTPDGRAVAVTLTEAPAERHPLLERLMQLVGVATAGDAPRSEVRVLDVADGRVLATLDRAELVRFAPAGDGLAVATQDGAVTLYDWPLRTPWGAIVAGASLAGAVVACGQAVVAAWRRRPRTARV